MNKTELRKQYNKHRFQILKGHGTIMIADSQENILIECKIENVRDFTNDDQTVSEYVYNALETNGWKHVRNVEESIE